MIPLVAAILPSLGVLIASKFVTTKINYYKLEDVVTYRLKIVHKIAAVISYIFFVFIVYIYITLYLYAGLEFVTVWPIWIPLAIYIMIIIHIFRNYRYSYITIDDEGITYKVFMGRKKYIPYMNIAEYNLKPYQDRFILRSSTGQKVVVRPVGMSLQQLLFYVSFRVTEGRWPRLDSSIDRKALEDSLGSNSGVLYLLEHPCEKIEEYIHTLVH
ncbi:hypothetical protein CYK04_06185 [Rothia dentocariosa]|nr:hypothetical protein CYK04_06185 [Rothia dentocariosa]